MNVGLGSVSLCSDQRLCNGSCYPTQTVAKTASALSRLLALKNLEQLKGLIYEPLEDIKGHDRDL